MPNWVTKSTLVVGTLGLLFGSGAAYGPVFAVDWVRTTAREEAVIAQVKLATEVKSLTAAVRDLTVLVKEIRDREIHRQGVGNATRS